jgi:hypothetical protein
MITETCQERTASYIPSKGVQVGSKDEAHRKVWPRIKQQMKVLRVTTLFPHIFLGNSAWRKQMNATNTRTYQFTGDKQNVFTS